MAWQQAGPSQVPVYGEPGGAQRPAAVPVPNPLVYGAGQDILRSGLGAYGEKLFGTGREYVQSNISRGHWTRIADQVAGGLTFRPPIFDINAPDLYIPFMAFGTFVVLSGIAFGLFGKFSPEALSVQFTKALLGWVANVILIRLSLYALGNADAAILDIVSYGGYAFVGLSISILARIIWSYSYYVMMPWTSLCMAIFLVKTMKRVLFAGARSYDRDSSKHHYLLLFMAAAQFPLSVWLGYLRRT